MLALLLIASVAEWVRSYWRFDAVAFRGVAVWSEAGTIYASRHFEDWRYYTGRAFDNGRLEEETGTTYRPYLPAWMWNHQGNRYLSVRWWAVVLMEAGGTWWFWRRRRERDIGFPVVTT